eukprot:13145219-Ditylum_brightwellii.AAC.1
MSSISSSIPMVLLKHSSNNLTTCFKSTKLILIRMRKYNPNQSLTQQNPGSLQSSCRDRKGRSFFSKHVLDKIGQKTLQAFAAKCGYNRNMAYDIRDGLSHLGGCEFTPLYHIKGTPQIQNFMWHYRTQSDTKKLLQIALAWAQRQSGTLEPILWENKIPLPHLEARWFPSLCTYFGATGLHLQLSYTSVYPSQHVNNQHIYDYSHRLKSIQTSQNQKN